MQQQFILIIAAMVAILLLLAILLLRSRRQHVSFDALHQPPAAARPQQPADAGPRPVQPLARATAPDPGVPPAPLPEEGHGVGSEVAAAVEDVVDQFVGLHAHPSGEAPAAYGDALTTLKGLGPKAAARLHEIGVSTFAQMAAWSEADVAAIDAQMGAFKGRIERDRWVEQARLLAKGDTAAFEAQFGKLG